MADLRLLLTFLLTAAVVSQFGAGHDKSSAQLLEARRCSQNAGWEGKKFTPGAEAVLRFASDCYPNAPFATLVEDVATGQMRAVGSNISFLGEHHEVSFRLPSSTGNFRLHVVGNGGDPLPGSPFGFAIALDPVVVQNCVGTWGVEGNTFELQQTASLFVHLMDMDNITITGAPFLFTVSVAEQPDAIADVAMNMDGPLEVITFTPKVIGTFTLNVGSGHQKVIGSPFSFRVTAGNVSVTNCIADWINGVSTFKAGRMAAARVVLRDAYNNTLTAANGKKALVDFQLVIVAAKSAFSDARAIPDPEFNIVADFQSGCEYIYFVAKLAGGFLLSIGTEAGAAVVNSPLEFTVAVGDMYVPACIGGFLTGAVAEAGSKVVLAVQLKDRFGTSLGDGTYDFTVSVEGKVGASRYITNVNTSMSQPGYTAIEFIVIAAGNYLLEVGDGLLSISGSPFPYTVTGGAVYVPFCTAEWLHDTDTFFVGEQVAIRVLLMDAYNNNISATTGRPNAFFPFTVRVLTSSGSDASIKNLAVVQDSYESGYVLITFDMFTSGTNSVIIGNGTDVSIYTSPLRFTVYPGAISMADSYLEWPYNASDFQVDTLVNIILNKRDIYGNPVEADFFASVRLLLASRTTSLRLFENPDNSTTYAISDLNMTTLAPASSGRVLISFTANAGTFLLEVGDGNTTVRGSPASFTTFSGVVNPSMCNCSGTGYVTAAVGQAANFDIQLIQTTGDQAYEMGANMSLRRTVRAFLTLGSLQIEATVIPDALTDGLYHANYSTTKSGQYNVSVTWVYNVICSGVVTVNAGPVVLAKSVLSGEGLSPVISRNLMSQIYILLVDSLGNPVQGQRSKIVYTITGAGSFQAQDVLDIGTGYSTAYTIFDVGKFTIGITYDGAPLPNTPLSITVVPEYNFPKANDDSLWTWEEVPIEFDVLGNDVVNNGSKTLAGLYKAPAYGSVVINGPKVRYTPRTGAKGTDVLVYILEDSNRRKAYGYVYIAIRTEPPDFTFWPSALVAIEGQPLSTLEDLNGFHVTYTNSTELLTLKIHADHGRVYLPADALQLWHDIGLQNTSTNTSSFNMTLLGTVGFINKALQDFLYIGDAYYNGNDTLALSVTNKNGAGDFVRIPIEVRAFNNPPYVTAPNFVLKDKTGILNALSGNTVAFKVDRAVDAITVGDPDEADNRDDGRIYRMEIVLEASDGSITMTLPEGAADSAEYREEGSYLWQPSTGVTISGGYFTLTAQAMKFRATSAECNLAFATISYNGTKNGEGLTIIANDMGNFGCSGDCISGYSDPQTATAVIIILTSIPRSSWWAYLKGMKIFGSSIASVGAAALILLLVICVLGKRHIRNRRRAESKDVEDLIDDTACDATRVYNPMWIPLAGEKQVVSEPNPMILQQRQQELRQRSREVEMEVEAVYSKPAGHR